MEHHVLRIKENKIHRHIFVVFFIMLMVGCGTTTKKTDSVLKPEVIEKSLPGVGDDDRVIVVPPPIREKYQSSPVVQGLLMKSKDKFDAKEFEAAANYIERGINISPNDPMLWQRLAVIRFEQGDFKQAKQLAKKSNVLVETDVELRAVNESIIDQVNRLTSP